MSIANWMSRKTREAGIDLGLLALRVGFGLAMLTAHGWGKLMSFSEKSTGFPDPIGVGPQASMALAIFAEVFCSAGLIVGLLTRLAAIPLVVTMAVAFFIVHGGQAFGERELAMAYLVPYVAIFLAGPGRISLDGLLASRLGRR